MKLPKSYKDVPLKHYIEISEVSFIDMDEIDKAVKILSILSEKTEDEILDLSIQDIFKYTKQVSFVWQEHKGKGVPTYVWLKGKKYHVNNDVRSLVGAEYIDMCSLTKDRKAIPQNLYTILAIYLQPVNWLGFKKRSCYSKGIQTIESRMRTAKDLQDLSASIAIELAGFFLLSWEALTKATQAQMKLEAKKAEKILKQSLKEMASENFGRGN